MPSTDARSAELRRTLARTMTWFFPSRRVRRWLRAGLFFLSGVGLGALGFGMVVAGDIYEYQDTVDGVHLPEVDAIVCLAGGRGRIAVAGDLWYRYWEMAHAPLPGAGRNPVPDTPPKLYLSGMGHLSNFQSLSHQVRRGVLGSLTPEDVVIERESSNTIENAVWLAGYAKTHGWEKILLITSSYHMKRAKLIFQRTMAQNGIPLEIETLSVFQEPFEPGEWRSAFHGIRVTLTEYIKLLYYQHLW